MDRLANIDQEVAQKFSPLGKLPHEALYYTTRADEHRQLDVEFFTKTDAP